MKLQMIVAICNGNGIGANNGLLWNIPEDLKHFANKTKNSIVIMGRKTYFSIPLEKRPLKNRLNIVVTSKPEIFVSERNDKVVFCKSREVKSLLNDNKEKFDNVFVIGGESIYKMLMHITQTIHITRVKKNFNCDTYFPAFESEFEKVQTSPMFFSREEYCDFCFEIYERKTDSKCLSLEI